MKIKNTTSEDILHKNSGVNFTANAYTNLDPSELFEFADDQMFNLLSAATLVLNDGTNDIGSPSDAWNAINKLIPQNLLVTTQYEMNDKDLKLAKSSIILDSATSGSCTIKIPGTFGSSDGRYVAGGYAISADYDIDDYVTIHIEDTDRAIAWAIALAQDPSASAPISDDDIKGMGVLPLIGQPMPEYPIVKSYTDDDLDASNQGWYFWPLVMGDGTPPAGECEIEPIGGYGFLPAGMYIIISYFRAIKTTGRLNLNYYWGKKE